MSGGIMSGGIMSVSPGNRTSVTQNSSRPSPVLIAPTHGGIARLSSPGWFG